MAQRKPLIGLYFEALGTTSRQAPAHHWTFGGEKKQNLNILFDLIASFFLEIRGGGSQLGPSFLSHLSHLEMTNYGSVPFRSAHCLCENPAALPARRRCQKSVPVRTGTVTRPTPAPLQFRASLTLSESVKPQGFVNFGCTSHEGRTTVWDLRRAVHLGWTRATRLGTPS